MLRQCALTLLCLFAVGGDLSVNAQQPAAPAKTSANTGSKALVMRPEDRPIEVRRGCSHIRFIVDSEDTGGAFSMVEANECGKPVTNLHRHFEMDEAFYVIEGSLIVHADGKTHTLGPGSYFFVPRGVPHAQGNPCPIPNKILVTFTPGGFERFLRFRAKVLETTTMGSPEFQAEMKKFPERFGQGVGPDPVGQVPCPAK